MKLDLIQFVTEIEELFDLQIPRYETSRMGTPRDVLDYVAAKSNVPNSPKRCFAAKAFYLLRRASMKLGTVNKPSPNDVTLEMFPNDDRKSFWSQLQDKSNLVLPPLRRPTWMVRACTMMLVTASAAFGVLVYRFTNSEFSALAAAFALGIELGTIVAFLTRRFAVYPPYDCRTMGRLAKTAMGLNFTALSREGGSVTTRDPWYQLHEVLAEEFGELYASLTSTYRSEIDRPLIRSSKSGT